MSGCLVDERVASPPGVILKRLREGYEKTMRLVVVKATKLSVVFA